MIAKKQRHLTKPTASKVAFASWCIANNANPVLLGKLLDACDRYAKNWARSTTDAARSDYWLERAHAAHEDAEDVAREMGYDLDWPGLRPTMRKHGGSHDVYLPD